MVATFRLTRSTRMKYAIGDRAFCQAWLAEQAAAVEQAQPWNTEGGPLISAVSSLVSNREAARWTYRDGQRVIAQMSRQGRALQRTKTQVFETEVIPYTLTLAVGLLGGIRAALHVPVPLDQEEYDEIAATLPAILKDMQSTVVRSAPAAGWLTYPHHRSSALQMSAKPTRLP